jgi:hypothetical protein
MIRFEIIANRSVQDDILDGLEAAIPEFLYSVVPVVHGRGSGTRKLGTATWPEENFLLIAYVDDDQAGKLREVAAATKARFPTEGIKMFELAGARDGLSQPG